MPSKPVRPLEKEPNADCAQFGDSLLSDRIRGIHAVRTNTSRRWVGIIAQCSCLAGITLAAASQGKHAWAAASRVPVMASDPAPEADGSIAGVDYTPFNVFASRPLRRDDAIGNGDFVASTGTTGFVKIGDWQFARPFRALFFAVQGQIKRFELGLGGVTASTDEPNEIHSGGTVFKNTSTTYVIRVQGTKWGAKPQCTVLEGIAFVQDSSSATQLSGGNVLEWNDGGMHRRSVTDAEMAEHVDALVQGDIGRARFAGAALPNVDEIAGRLRMGYQGVFHAPESPADGYLTLAGARLEAGLVTEALGSVRHAAANVNALDAAANARIALTKAAAAAVRGKADASRSFLRAAYALDPALAKEESTATFFLPSVRGLL